MLICDEHLLLRSLIAGRPDGLDETRQLAITPTTWWRILRPAQTVVLRRAQGVHPKAGRITNPLDVMSDAGLHALLEPGDRFDVIDSRSVLPTAAAIGADNPGSMYVLEMAAAALVYNSALHFLEAGNISDRTRVLAADLDIEVRILG